MHNCDLVNLDDMLQNGTVISGTFIEKPHSFLHGLQHCHPDHCAGGIQPVRRPEHQPDPSGSVCGCQPQEDRREVEAEMKELVLTPVKKSNQIVGARLRDEINRGVQTIQYQVVTLMTTNGQAPFITVFMYLNEAGATSA